MIVLQILWLTVSEAKNENKIKWEKLPCQGDTIILDGF